jgi:hypothetical protein
LRFITHNALFVLTEILIKEVVEMKKILSLSLLILVFLVFSVAAGAAGTNPRKDATEVDDAFTPYTADDWIVSPDEEPLEDQQVDNAPECDIKGVIACYDADYLRVDILLANGISDKWDLYYSIKVEYEGLVEYYTYYTISKKFVYVKEKNGKILRSKTLTGDNSKDCAGVTDSGDEAKSDVYFIINKDDHIGGKKGQTYYLTTYFLSGYIDKKGNENTADDTITVDLHFKR